LKETKDKKFEKRKKKKKKRIKEVLVELGVRVNFGTRVSARFDWDPGL
jgi:hypothetical protein